MLLTVAMLCMLSEINYSNQVIETKDKIQFLRKMEDKHALTVAKWVVTSSNKNSIEVNLILSIAYNESYIDQGAVGTQGDTGLMQVMPFWSKSKLCKNLRLWHGRDNIECGTRILAHYIDLFDGHKKLGVTAYNRGHGGIIKDISRGRNPYTVYTKKIFNTKSRLDNVYSGRTSIRNSRRID
jgi:soluble lytic murein transglycosylase-like protein